MSIIGDALNRADEENRSGQNGAELAAPTPVGKTPVRPTTTHTDARRYESKPAVTETIMSSAKGIAHPRPSVSVNRQKESSVFGMVLLSLLGFAGYMIVFPNWIDSVWNFESPKALTVTPPSEIGDRSPRNSPTLSKPQIVPTPSMQAAPNSDPEPSAQRKSATVPRTRTEPPKPKNAIKQEPTTQPAPRSISKLPIQARAPRPRFQVDGVMLGGRRTLAVVNGAIVGVGDEVDGATVRAITDNAVALEIDGRIRRTPLRAPKPASDENKSSSE